MAKMIKVESCGECSHCAYGGFQFRGKFLCGLLPIVGIIDDLEKILPNCPLEDYPETKTSTCKSCSKPIMFTGKYWKHTTWKPRHAAVPLINPELLTPKN